MVIWKALGFEPTFLSTSKLRNLSHICEREQEKSLGLLPPPWVHRDSVTISLRSGALKESSTYRGAPQAGTSGFAWWLIYRILLLNTDIKMVCQYTYIHMSHSCSAKYFPFQIWRTEVRTQYVTSVRSSCGSGASSQRQQCEELQKLSTEQMSSGHLNPKPSNFIQPVVLEYAFCPFIKYAELF